MSNGENPISKLPLRDRFPAVAVLLNSASPTERREGWYAAYLAYRKQIERDIRNQIGETTKGAKTMGGGESATDITSKVLHKGIRKFWGVEKSDGIRRIEEGQPVSFNTEAGLKKYIDQIVNSVVIDSIPRPPKPTKLLKNPATGKYDLCEILPPESHSPVNGEPLAPSGDRPSKYDSGDYWNHFYATLASREGQLLADQFQEWLRLWAEKDTGKVNWRQSKEDAAVKPLVQLEPDAICISLKNDSGKLNWHHRWIALSEYTAVKLHVQQEPDAIRVSFGRMLGRLRKDKAFWDHFLVNFPSGTTAEKQACDAEIPDVLPDDDDVQP